MQLTILQEWNARASQAYTARRRRRRQIPKRLAQQREIVILAAQGLTNSDIADRLFLSPRTVAWHLHHSYPKLGFASRHQLRDLIDHVATPQASALWPQKGRQQSCCGYRRRLGQLSNGARSRRTRLRHGHRPAPRPGSAARPKPGPPRPVGRSARRYPDCCH